MSEYIIVNLSYFTSNPIHRAFAIGSGDSWIAWCDGYKSPQEISLKKLKKSGGIFEKVAVVDIDRLSIRAIKED